ncbi:MAG: Helix-turn-helix domain [Pseudomonadota bacterium]
MSVAPSDFARALQEARLARSLSVLDAAQAMRLSDQQINGLERDDHANFYSAVYAERAAIGYAKFLNVSTTLLGGPPFEGATPPPLVASVATVPAAPPTRQRLTSPSAGLYGAVGVVLAGITIFLIIGRDGGEPPSPHDAKAIAAATSAAAPAMAAAATDVSAAAPVAPAATPTPATQGTPVNTEVLPPPEAPQPALREAAPEPVPSEVSRTRRFWLVVNRPALINVSDASGKKILAGRQPISEGQRVVGEPPFQLETDDPDSIDVFYLGNRVRPLQSSTNRYSARFGAPE